MMAQVRCSILKGYILIENSFKQTNDAVIFDLTIQRGMVSSSYSNNPGMSYYIKYGFSV